MIFIDSNIFIDLLEPEGEWRTWSQEALARANRSGPLVANFVVAAEIAPQFDSMTNQRRFFDALGIELRAIDAEAAFLAGKAHIAYRARGGTRDAMLADFLIGAHASVLDATLLTRDRQRFAAYFPDLTLTTPETDNG